MMMINYTILTKNTFAETSRHRDVVANVISPLNKKIKDEAYACTYTHLSEVFLEVIWLSHAVLRHKKGLSSLHKKLLISYPVIFSLNEINISGLGH